jgi:drug/metabolite transporter (DMT)-like permease
VGYAVGGLYARRSMGGVPVAVSATGQNVAALFVVLPFALFSLPEGPLAAKAVFALVVLGVVGTGLAAIVFFRLIARIGATRTATVAYLVPVAALFYGALFLGEQITAGAVAGLALILAGVAGASGLGIRPPRRSRKAPPTP